MAANCTICGHSRAAHTDGKSCVLCKCRSERIEPAQERLPFRASLAVRTTRKR